VGAPDQPGLALAARLVGLPGDRTAWAGFAAVLGEGSDEVGMHRRVLPLGTSSAGGRISLLCIAGCIAVSGRGYYVTGPALDVPGRPGWVKVVLVRPTDGAKCLAKLRTLLLDRSKRR
jgi:hypothetical protein